MMAKRLLDVMISAIGLIVLSPLIAVCALMVRRGSPGPIMFSQPRLGLYGRPFRLWKFRTMHSGAREVRNSDGSAFVGDHDPRVTPAGRFLRATSFDELPQLWNVLRGDMSLVGPRPDQVDQRRFYTEAEKKKLDVKPGLTGLAQINGRNQIPWEKRKALDVEYVERRSMVLDLKILGKTIPYVCLRKNIHSGA
jgi:lipopolysaccharide/colanic/teichoic acid biosynthesis glycosyltransferase